MTVTAKNLNTEKYRLLFRDGLGTEEYNSVSDAEKSAKLIMEENRRPLAIILEQDICKPPFFSVARYIRFGKDNETRKAFRKYCM